MILLCTQPVVVLEEICRSAPFQGPAEDMLVGGVEVLVALDLAVVGNTPVIIQLNGNSYYYLHSNWWTMKFFFGVNIKLMIF